MDEKNAPSRTPASSRMKAPSLGSSLGMTPLLLSQRGAVIKDPFVRREISAMARAIGAPPPFVNGSACLYGSVDPLPAARALPSISSVFGIAARTGLVAAGLAIGLTVAMVSNATAQSSGESSHPVSVVKVSMIDPPQSTTQPAVGESLTDPAPPVSEAPTTIAPTSTTTTTTTKPKPTTTVPKKPADGGAVGDDVWVRLAQCESGGRNVNTGNGYYGYFQFSATTWRSLGGTGLPSDHSYEEQKALAIKLQQRSGWGQWPACSKKLGLR